MKFQNLEDIHKICTYIWKNICLSQRYKIYFRALAWLGKLVKFGSFFVHTILTQENQSIKTA